MIAVPLPGEVEVGFDWLSHELWHFPHFGPARDFEGTSRETREFMPDFAVSNLEIPNGHQRCPLSPKSSPLSRRHHPLWTSRRSSCLALNILSPVGECFMTPRVRVCADKTVPGPGIQGSQSWRELERNQESESHAPNW
jgi:hypothetical protein